MDTENLPSYVLLANKTLDRLVAAKTRIDQHDIMQRALALAYEQGVAAGAQQFGPLCKRHERVVAWLSPPPPNQPGGTTCFGCYLDGIKLATRRLQRLELGLPPDDSLRG